VRQFKQPVLKQLTDQQVRFAPPARRQEQLQRAERLLHEIEDHRQYPYAFVVYRITEYRPDSHADLLISGADLRHDLYLFMAALSRSLPPIPVDEVDEPVLTLDEVSRQFNVSTKTISRWREQGLLSRQVLCDGRRQLGFPKSAIDNFVATHPERVSRGSRFSHLSEAEKEEILRRARQCSREGKTLTEASRAIASKLGRSAETVRYTIKNFDRTHPDQALFPDVPEPLVEGDKQAIYQSYTEGVPVETIAQQMGRTRTSMYRVINEVRAENLLSRPLDYIYSPEFDDPAAEQEIMAPMPDLDKFLQQRQTMRAPRDVPPELAALYEEPLLTREQERHLFRQMNFLKHKIHKIRERLKADPSQARAADFQQIEQLQAQQQQIKDLLIRCNMRLVIAIAKKKSAHSDNFWELQSDGNMSLIRAVEKFDYSRGNKFSTYASWAIMKNFARSIPDERQYRERYMTGQSELFEAKQDQRSDEHECLAAADQARDRVNELLGKLDERDREIIRLRAGMEGDEMTLEDIGQRMGITKERVRQLYVRSMKKLRELANEQQNSDL
jgi:RNA polymerase primary sigma factor